MKEASPKTLLILIGGHMAHGPRPQKEAAAARAAGFRVLVRCVWWDALLAEEDLELARVIGVDIAPVADLRNRSFRTQVFRVKQRFAGELYRRFGLAFPRSFGLAAPEMLREAIDLSPDLTMVHSEAGLWVANQLLKRGFRVGVDFEDWFSEDLPMEDRKGRPVEALKHLERELLSKANLTLATTCAMAEALAADAECPLIPNVIPNCFPWLGAPGANGGVRDERDPHAVSFYWFSQTIGPGRGLETLGAVLPQLKGNWELHLRGELRGYRPWFDSVFAPEIRDRVIFEGMVPNSDLAARSASHDVGLALEVPHCPSRDLTATNKIFEYLRCGLAVIATATKGQMEVMERCPEAGWVIPPGDAVALTKVMQSCLDDRSGVAMARAKASDAASGIWAWEHFETELGSALISASRG